MSQLTDFLRPHLTIKQLSDALEGTFEQSTQFHLATCSRCKSELDTLSNTIAVFRTATHNYAVTQVLTVRTQQLPHEKRRFASFRGPIWALPLTVCSAAVALALTFGHSHREKALPPATSVTQGAPSSTAEDEALLNGIDRDLSTSIPPSLEPLAVPTATTLTATKN